MKTSAQHSLGGARTASLTALIHKKSRRGGLSVLMLTLFALHFLVFIPSVLAVSRAEGRNGGSQRWSLRVDRVDTRDVSLDPSFESALHKNLLRELAKTKRFKQVLFNDGRDAGELPDLLVLKMTVQEYASGSEDRWATLDDTGLLGEVSGVFLRFLGWTTASGVTKLNAHIQLYTREGHLVLDDLVEGGDGFAGDNSRATHNLAHNVAAALKRLTLPDTAIVASEQETPRKPKYQVGTITAAQCHRAPDADARVASCEVSVRVGNTAYGVLYAAPAGTDNVRYETGRELLVLVGEDTITYNDVLGNSFQLPILSRAAVTQPGDR